MISFRLFRFYVVLFIVVLGLSTSRQSEIVVRRSLTRIIQIELM